MTRQCPPITFVLPGRNRSGGVRVTVELANLLLQRGHQVRLLTRRPDGLRAVAREWIRRATSSGNSEDDWVTHFKGEATWFKELSEISFAAGEVVVAVGSYVVPAVRELNRDITKVRFNHGLQAFDPQRMDRAWRGDMPTLSVAATSARILMCNYGISHVWIVPNGVSTQEYYEDRTVSRRGIGTIYSPNQAKCPQDIIDILHRIGQSFPDLPRYAFSASDKPAALSCELFERLPSVARARRIYSSAQLWLLMSRDEGLPGPVLEAMACGAVVISTDQAGSREVITSSQNGILFPVGDLDACMDRIRQLLADPAEQARLRDAGYETVRRFSWSVAAERFEQAIGEIVDGKVHSALTLESTEPALL